MKLVFESKNQKVRVFMESQVSFHHIQRTKKSKKDRLKIVVHWFMTKSTKLMEQPRLNFPIACSLLVCFFGVFWGFFVDKIHWNLNEKAMLRPSRVLIMKHFTLNCLEKEYVVHMLYDIAKMDQIALAFMLHDGKMYHNKWTKNVSFSSGDSLAAIHCTTYKIW